MFSYDLQSIAKNRETFNRDGKRERRRSGGSLSKKSKLAASARKQRFAARPA